MVKIAILKLVQTLRTFSDFIYYSQTMKVLLSFVVIAFVQVNSQQQPQLPVVQFDMADFMAHQQQHMQHMQPQGRDHQQMHMEMNMHEQGRQMEAEEPQVGSPLMGLKMGMPFGIHHALGGLGIPGMKLSNFHAGNIGGLKFGNMLLGAENPMAEESDGQLEAKKWKWHKHISDVEPFTGAAQHYQYQAEPQLAAPQQQHQFFPFHLLNGVDQNGAEPQLAAAPQQPQGFLPFHHHFLNGDSNLGSAQQQQQIEAHQAQQYQLAAPQMQEIEPQRYQVAAPQMQQFDMQPVGPPMQMHIPQQFQQPIDFNNMPMIQMQEDGARHWGKWGKKGGDSYGYGGYG
jgi:hypothetical protein